MGTIVEFEQDPLRSRMRKSPKAAVEASVVLPFGEHKKVNPDKGSLMRKDDDKAATNGCAHESLQPA